MPLPETWRLFGDDHIPHQLLLLARMIDRESSRQLLVEHRLTLAEWRVLAFVGVTGPASASEIGAAGEIDRAEISRAASKLLEAGWIERRPDESNRKRLIISLTEKGQEHFLQIRTQRRAYFQAIIADIPTDERKLMGRHLADIALKVLGE